MSTRSAQVAHIAFNAADPANPRHQALEGAHYLLLTSSRGPLSFTAHRRLLKVPHRIGASP